MADDPAGLSIPTPIAGTELAGIFSTLQSLTVDTVMLAVSGGTVAIDGRKRA